MSDPTVAALVTALSIGVPATISAIAGLVVALKTRREVAANTAKTIAAAQVGEQTHSLVNGVKAQLEQDLADTKALLDVAHKHIADLQGSGTR